MIATISERLARRRDSQGGFTLIELLVVIVILGVLAGVVVFSVGGIKDKGENAAFATDARTLRTAQEAYYAKFGRYATPEELVAAGFLASPPELSDLVLAPDKQSFIITCDATKAGCGASGAIAVGGTLVINSGTTPLGATLNPAVTSEGGTHSISEDMFNGLLRYEKDGSIGGDLAQSFSFDTVASSSNPNCPPTTTTDTPVPAATGYPKAVTCDASTTVATFVLREGVKFHDGTTLTPADVEFSFEKAILAAHGRTRAINPTLGVVGSSLTTWVPPEAIQTLPPTAGNGGTVKFNLRQVFAPLRFTLNVTEAPIIPRSAYEPCWNAGTLFGGTACTANTNPVGTGPFKFGSLDGSQITTLRFPDYFRFENGIRLPYLDKVIKKVVTGNAADSLRSSAVDVAGISNADRPAMASDSRFVLTSTPRGSGGGNCITTIAFNTTKRQAGNATVAPTAVPTGDATSPYYGQNKPNSNENASPHQIVGDSRVREAIFKALDRDKFHQDIAFGAGKVADAPVHSIFQPNGAYQGPQPLPTFDRTAAGALLDAAGWSDTSNPDGFRRALNHPNETHSDPQLAVPDGTKLALEYLASTGNETFAQEVKSQLKTVGVDVTPVHGNNGSVVAPRIFHARTFDMAQISYCNNDEPQFGVRRQYHTDQLIQTNAFTNASGYKSTMMDQLWLEASKAPDTATYQLKFLAIQRLALGLGTPSAGVTPGALEIAQKIPMVQMLESAGTRAYRATCQGFNNNNTGLYFESAYCTN